MDALGTWPLGRVDVFVGKRLVLYRCTRRTPYIAYTCHNTTHIDESVKKGSDVSRDRERVPRGAAVVSALPRGMGAGPTQ